MKNIPLLGNLNIQHHQLQNGLQLAIVVDTTTPIFTYQTWFKVGSADERAGKQGLAHLFEHMMFRTTSNRKMGEWEKEVNEHGGTGINAYTSRDQTVYHFTFPNEKFSLAAELESDRMHNLIIEPEMFETEKGAVLTERNRGLDEPVRYLWEELYKTAYAEHNYKYSIIGEEESIKNFSVEEAKNFYQKYYSPNNALIIVVGDVEPNSIIKIIEEHYGKISPQKISERPTKKEPPQQEHRFRKIHHPKATQRMLAKAWHIPNMLHQDYPAFSMVGRLLTSGKTSLLQERLVNRAKVTSLYADAFVGKDMGTFEFFVQLSEKETFEEIEKIFFDALHELANGKITDEQFRIAKNTLQKDFYHAIVSPSTLARVIGDSFIYANDLSYQIKVVEKMEHLAKKDIQKVVQHYLIDGKSTTLHLTPQ
mgnify:CR=1 FL=1